MHYKGLNRNTPFKLGIFISICMTSVAMVNRPGPAHGTLVKFDNPVKNTEHKANEHSYTRLPVEARLAQKKIEFSEWMNRNGHKTRRGNISRINHNRNWRGHSQLNSSYTHRGFDSPLNFYKQLEKAHFNFSKDHSRQPSRNLYDNADRMEGGKFGFPSDGHVWYSPRPQTGSLWPMPAVMTCTKEAHEIKSEFSFSFDRSMKNSDILEWYSKRINDNVRHLKAINQVGTIERNNVWHTIGYVSLAVANDSKKYPHLTSNESYTLHIDRRGCQIESNEVWGAIRALETLSQLLYKDHLGRVLLRQCSIKDAPRFPHRGLMIDTSRHFISLATIVDNLEAMAMNKLNVFHWHIVDEQSFPYQSKLFPDLSDKGAFHPKAVYTHDDIKYIISEARLRGIRVIPEFDTPGHTLSWGLGQRDLLTPCYDKHTLKPSGFYGPINPIRDSTYKFLRDLFTEVMDLFKDQYLHLGGDETHYECWGSNPEIIMWLGQQTPFMNTSIDFERIRGLYILYEERLQQMVKDLGLSRPQGSGSIVWQEVADRAKVDNNTIVQVWKAPPAHIARYIRQGHKVIFSTTWYADSWKRQAEWVDYYTCMKKTGTRASCHFPDVEGFLGGEVCMWNEMVDDADMTSRIWPRASAVAERLWSQEDVNDWRSAAPRMEQQRCRMLRKGIPVGVASGPSYCGDTYRGFRKSSGVFNPDMAVMETPVQLVQISAMDKMQVLLIVIIVVILLLRKGQPINRRMYSLKGKLTKPSSGLFILVTVVLMYIIGNNLIVS